MSDYTEFFLGTPSDVIQYETLELTHTSFSKVFRIVRNAANGLTATLEGGGSRNFQFYPMNIKQNATRSNLDSGLQIDLGDLGELIPKEIDNIVAEGTNNEKPVIKYRTYRSDDLSAPLFGPIIFEMRNITFNEEGASFLAEAPRLNVNGTGENYTVAKFTMLRAFQ